MEKIIASITCLGLVAVISPRYALTLDQLRGVSAQT